MKKFIITESERNTIRQMYGLNEQTTTTPVTSAATPTTTTTTTPVKTPMFGTPEQRAAAKAKRVAQGQKHEETFLKAAEMKGMTRDEYSNWLDKQSKTPNASPDYLGVPGNKKNNNPAPCKGGKCTGLNDAS